MREIKFRAWDESLSRIYILSGLYTYERNDDMYMVDYAESLEKRIPIFKSHVMQYTGLKDKNGVEIYEGDIVTSDWADDDAKYRVIEWHEEDTGFLARHLSKRPYAEPEFFMDNTFEVVGNIYETPELLENA